MVRLGYSVWALADVATPAVIADAATSDKTAGRTRRRPDTNVKSEIHFIR
jgi:hypothetical protein